MNEAVEAARDWFTESVPQDLVAGQDTYSLLDGFLRLRLLQRKDSADAEPKQYLHQPEWEGQGGGAPGAVPDNAGGYAIVGDGIQLEDEPEATIVGGLVVHLEKEPHPPIIGKVESASAGAFILAVGGTTDSPSDPPVEDDALNGILVDIVSGAGAGQRRKIADYVAATRSASLTANWTTTPDSTSKYATISRLPRNFHDMLIIGGAMFAREDNDEDASTLRSLWNSNFEQFLAYVEQRTFAQEAVVPFDPYDGA